MVTALSSHLTAVQYILLLVNCTKMVRRNALIQASSSPPSITFSLRALRISLVLVCHGVVMGISTGGLKLRA